MKKMKKKFRDEALVITVKSQEALDEIHEDFQGCIRIAFGTQAKKARVAKKYNFPVNVIGNACVEAWGISNLIAYDNAYVEAYQNTHVTAYQNARVEAWDYSYVVANGNSTVIAWDKSIVIAKENSTVFGREDSTVRAKEESHVSAYENCTVDARGKSQVFACDNCKVDASGNANVYANGNVQVLNRKNKGCIELADNARIVYMPQTIEEYCNFYNIKHDNKTGKFFKCVHKSNGIYFSDFDTDFEYEIGKKAIPDSFDNDPDEVCSHGIYVGSLITALDTGRKWDDFAILELEVKLDDMVVTYGYSGMVRCKEVTVLREVPLEECGMYGKFLAQKRNNNV